MIVTDWLSLAYSVYFFFTFIRGVPPTISFAFTHQLLLKKFAYRLI